MSRGKQRERPLPGKRGHGIMNENQTERGRAMKITARAIKRGAAGLLLGAALVLLWDWTAHPIELNMVTLPEQIAAFHNRESEDWDPSEITVYGGVSVGDRGVSGQRHPGAGPDRAVQDRIYPVRRRGLPGCHRGERRGAVRPRKKNFSEPGRNFVPDVV